MLLFQDIKFFFAISIFSVIILAGLYPFKRKQTTLSLHTASIGETLATGVFLGAGLLHMLPEGSHLFHQLGHAYPIAFLITGGTFLLFLWFEHLGQALYHTAEPHHHDHAHTHHHHAHNHPAFAILAWGMLSIHSLILGVALGLNDSESIMMMLFLAIITHKWAESFALSVQLNQSALSKTWRYVLFFSFALMTPIGIFCGNYFDERTLLHPLVDAILMSASAGTFLYLGTLHGLERCVLVERCCNLKDFSFVIIGFLLMAGAAVYL